MKNKATIYLLGDDIDAEIKGYVDTLKDAKNWVKLDTENHYYWVAKFMKIPSVKGDSKRIQSHQAMGG